MPKLFQIQYFRYMYQKIETQTQTKHKWSLNRVFYNINISI